MPRSTNVCLSGALQKRQCAVVEILLVWFAVGSASSNSIVLLISILFNIFYSVFWLADLDLSFRILRFQRVDAARFHLRATLSSLPSAASAFVLSA